MRRYLALTVLGLAAACGSRSVGSASASLEPLENADDPSPGVAGARCNLATHDGGDSSIRLVAFRDAAIVRTGGEPTRLRFRGRDLRRGGSFEGEGVAIELGGISEPMANGPTGVGIPAVVAVRRGDSVENFEAVWTCGLMRPDPGPAR